MRALWRLALAQFSFYEEDEFCDCKRLSVMHRKRRLRPKMLLKVVFSQQNAGCAADV